MYTSRDYAALVGRVSGADGRAAGMKRVVDCAWHALSGAGVSWIGFYVHEGRDELVLACCRDKPACSPIGLHGACGRAFLAHRPLIVRDVKALGENYIACDPRDQSEVVLPLLDSDGTCWGVLDVDSYDRAAFSERDADGFELVLRAAGLLAADVRLAATEFA